MIPFSKRRFANSKTNVRKKPKTEFEKQTARLDKYFSEYIRLSGMDSAGFCTCFTCGVKKPWNERKTHAGHFIGKHKTKYFRVRWEEKAVQCQCFNCNGNREGMQYQFGLNIDKKYGLGSAAKIQIKSTRYFNRDLFDMEKAISYYREKVNFIKKRHGIK